MNTRLQSLIEATPQSLRLQFGELSAQEIRTIRAVLEYVAGEVEVKPTAERQNAADAAPTPRDARRLAAVHCSALRRVLDHTFDGCRDGCLHCGAVNELVAGLITEIEQSGSSSVIEKLEQAIVNIYRWTGSRRVARECRRVLPDVVKRERKPNDKAQAAPTTTKPNSNDE